jgi:eukaryotic-like serine/threonine-protein kinase
MTIPSGTRLGPYEIASLIGAGGMGEVYQAQDTKLGRGVAIKVLPEQLARDPERLERFQREAKILAALSHPNIAAIYGLEEANGTHYLVMELVPGETLADRIRREGPVPVREALAIAAQIAEALEAAHNSEKGIIHRDLKPANVRVTPQGRVKVLDFGLAKFLATDAVTDDPSNLPTLTVLPTRHGVIMGTPAYMSPEQARGKPVDKRTDVWAFGCVLYELLTGQQVFQGETFSDTIAALIERNPQWQALPAATPANICDLLRHCLQKDLQRRLRDIADARIQIEDALSPAVVPAAKPSGAGAAAWRLGLLPSLCWPCWPVSPDSMELPVTAR